MVRKRLAGTESTSKYKIVLVQWKDITTRDNAPLYYDCSLVRAYTIGILIKEYKDPEDMNVMRIVYTLYPKINENDYIDIPSCLVTNLKTLGYVNAKEIVFSR